MGSDEIEEIKAGLNQVLSEEQLKREEEVRRQAAVKTADALKGLDVFATREEITALIKKQNEDIENLKALLLRARNQGKAHISEQQNDANSRLKEIYKGTSLESAFDKT